MKSVLLCVAAAGMMLTLGSCAEKVDGDYNAYETKALAAWIAENSDPSIRLLAENIQEQGGYYVDVLEVGDQAAKPVNDTICWVKFEFSGRDLAGNLAVTRFETEAHQQGTYTKYTHYVPYYKFCGTLSGPLYEGTHLALRNELTLGQTYYDTYKNERGFTSRKLSLRPGSKVRLYLPSSVVGSGGAAGDGGYQGQYALSAGRPFVVTMSIVTTIKNPLEAEGTDVDLFAKNNGGLQEPKTDEKFVLRSSSRAAGWETLPDHPYQEGAPKWFSAVDSIPQLYVNLTFTPETKFTFPSEYKSVSEPYNAFSALEQNIRDTLKNRFGEYAGVKKLDSDSVTMTGTAKIWYIGRFLDGFIFDSNIPGVRRLIYGETSTKGEALSVTPENSQFIKAWYYTVPNLRYGQWAALITTSSLAYGSQGVAGSSSSSSSTTNNNYDYMNYYNYYNSYYGNNGYYGGYYDNYYGGYNNGYYNSYDNVTTTPPTTTTTTTTTTEIPAFTPLIFEIYIEPKSK